MTRLYVQPLSTTREARGLYYCYNLQFWVRDGRIEACGHIGTVYQGTLDCYACDHAGEWHGACPACH